MNYLRALADWREWAWTLVATGPLLFAIFVDAGQGWLVTTGGWCYMIAQVEGLTWRARQKSVSSGEVGE